MIIEAATSSNIVRGVYSDEYHLFSRFGTLFRPKFATIREHLITKIFKLNMLPSFYQYPSYLVISASMNNRVIEEGEIPTGIYIPRDSYIWDVSLLQIVVVDVI